MKKKYDLPQEEENSELNMVNEPMASAYGMNTEITILPALTREEEEELITGEELLEAVCEHIHELFNKK